MAKEELHPYQRQTLDLFSTAWTSKLMGDQTDSDTSTKALAKYTAEAKDPSPGVYIWSTILAIHQYASSSPQALDFMLLIYASACNQFPNAVSNEYGHGPAAGLQQLKWWLVEEADGFQGVVMPPKNIGIVDATDRSNLLFNNNKVDRDVNRVLSEIEEWREERTSWLIAAAMQARCFSLDVIRVNDGRQIKSLIDSGLNREQSRWSKADFIGACIMIRGCAKSILEHLGGGETNDKLDSWKNALKTFLRHDEQSSSTADFVVSYHASLALKNLRTGPKDETSSELFASNTWLL